MNDPVVPHIVNQEQQLEAPQKELVLPTRFVGHLKKGSATPSVKNVENWVGINTGAVTVTNFMFGQEGQPLNIMGDGHTTVANNANIKTNTGANKLLAANTLYTFRRINSVWIEK